MAHISSFLCLLSFFLSSFLPLFLLSLFSLVLAISNDGHLEIHNFVKFIDDLSFYQNNLQEKLER